MDAVSPKVCTRFAPSPSGQLHVGGARTALFCWAYARRFGGRFILRIEDTDRKRSSESAGLDFLDDLHWLGIDWDEGPEFEGRGGGGHGPYIQSHRFDIYRKYIDQLLESGKAYRAFESPEELAVARKLAEKEQRNYRYDRAAMRLDQKIIEQYLSENRPYVVRFLLPDDIDTVMVHDSVLGDVQTRLSEMDDFVILKADGCPTYHFAVVVDDALMVVTHVIRGQEHLTNTARHVLLQDALGYHRPVYAHVSTILSPGGKKMSKRDKDRTLRNHVRQHNISESTAVNVDTWNWWLSGKDHQLDPHVANALANELGVMLPEINVDDFRRAGYLPEVLINYLALLGWSPGSDIEHFDAGFLIERFDLDRIIKSPASFDREKLLAFNHDAIQSLTTQQFVDRFREHILRYHCEFIDHLTKEQFELFAIANQKRSKTLDDTIESCRFFILEDDAIVIEESKATRKALENGEPNGYSHLQTLLPLLKKLAEWKVDQLEVVVTEYAAQHAAEKLGKVAQPLRIAVSGSTISPAIFETLVILGRDSVIRRIERCLAQRRVSCPTD